VVEVQDFRLIIDHVLGIYKIYPNLIKKRPKGHYVLTGWTWKHSDQLQSYLFIMARLGNEKTVVISRYHIINNATNWTSLS
jgi:hypothetical protein